ncbi:endochitinase-like [Anopheles moucheti]|uniref:endochitinase-like n=1 Tax=Anopheles moucheti TaxID=186751 RepID=UPI0022F03879|nr:endochitinase-like [Anopheles moucheti]
MGAGRHSRCSTLFVVLSATWFVFGRSQVEGAHTTPALFLTVKSSNFCMTKVDNVQCGYLIVTDILISPDGMPLPFFHDNSVSKKKSGLKIIASFGGSVVPSELFAFLTCDDKRRGAFVNNLIEFTRAHGFHGVDLAWLYPAPQERDQYVRLLRDLRLACDRNGLVLTVTVPSRPSVIEVNYPVEKLEKYADYVILSTTEFRKLRKTSFIAPLYSCSPGSSNSIDYHVDRWKMAGLSCGKIVIVIQTMTLTYKLYIQNEYRVGTPALQLKIRPYYKICRKLYSGSLEIWDSNVKSPYAFRDLSWYSYENEKSIKEKVCFVVQQGLGGLAVFYYDEDDPINICGDGQYPLTAIVVAALQSQYLPPSVITDSQIYHYESPSLTPLSQLDYRQYSEGNSNQPLVVYVEEKQPYSNAFLPDVSNTQPGTQLVSQPTQPMLGSLSFNADESTSPMQMSAPVSVNGYSSVEKMFYGAESGSDEYEEGFFLPYEEVKVGQGVDVTPTKVESPIMFSDPESLPSAVQLFSETVKPQNSHTCQLFSEKSHNHPVAYTTTGTTRCKECSTSRPCPHCASQSSAVSHGEQQTVCPCKYPGIKIFATAHAPTPATTTTMAPPVMHFFTMAPAALKPPTCCHGCQQCVKVVATSSADVPNVVGHALPCPCTTPAPVGPHGHLYSEHSFASSVPGVQIQAQAVGPQPVVPFTPFEVKLCPHDGILHDPHDRRSYYLCKRGLPMSDENKFSCAHGYIFHEASKKCVPEGSFK